MANFTKIDPANMAETGNLVQVSNISPDSSEKKVIDFFQYCGDIIEYEIVPVENGFEALLLFDKCIYLFIYFFFNICIFKYNYELLNRILIFFFYLWLYFICNIFL